MNWRKPLIFAGLHLRGSRIPQYLKEIERVEKLSQKEIKKYQEDKLRKLLLHAYKNVPYYHRILPKAGVIKKGNIHLENFNKIPILTKDIIRKEGKNLYSKDYKKRRPYENTSGGSTGEPVKFIQDKEYWHRNIANKLYFNRMLGKDIGEKEINLWGSERDIFRNSLSPKERVTNFLYNRTFLNAFKVDEDKLKKFTSEINRVKPESMWVYVESIDLLAKFIEKNDLSIHSPKIIISTAGTLFPEIRERVERIFRCPVYNQYGSREVGPVAIECKYQQGLHCFPWSHKLELVGKGDLKNVIVSDLTNYSMPLIRYKIGDIAKKADKLCCECGRNTLFFKEVSGRVISHFITENGDIVHGQYFIHAFYFRDCIKRFQIIQKNHNLVVCNIVLEKEKNETEIEEIEDKIKLVMGNNCKVKFEIVDEIRPSKSGKYLYIVCETM